MATKAQIQTIINDQLQSGQVGGITAVQHRDVLKDDSASILENIYSDMVTDSETTETVTTANANFEYSIVISKVGRHVTITGFFVVVNNASLASQIFEFSNAEYNANTDANYYGVAHSGTATIPIQARGAFLRVSRSVLAGEIYQFSITYPVKD